MNKTEEEQKLLENGLCFLLRAIKNLNSFDESNKSEELKYSILHLFSGIFLILKARLCREHWSLLVSNVDKTTLKKFKNGDFYGVGFEQCQERLLKILHLKKLKDDKDILKNLRETRNKIEHFIYDPKPPTAKSLLYKCLSFAIDFIDEHIKASNLDEKNKNYMEEIKQEYFSLENFCREKMRSIGSLLDNKPIVLTCDECDNKALVHAEGGDSLECLFCHNRVSQEGYPDIMECTEMYCDGINPIGKLMCHCGGENGIVALPSGSDKYLCLYCQERFVELYTCEHCNTQFPVNDHCEESGLPMQPCPDCDGHPGTVSPSSSYDS